MRFPAVCAWCARVEGQSRGLQAQGSIGVPAEREGSSLGVLVALGGLSVLVSCLVFVLCETAAWE